MKKCIYCREMKKESEFTIEHVMPQFLGGAYCPDDFKNRDVCAKCNSNLGLFVDAAFEKNFLVYSYLNENAYSFFDPTRPVGLPIRCMGPCDLVPPHMTDEEVCEFWLGPLGEQIFWIRPKDDRLYWYVGGNPRTTKTARTIAYFLWSERSIKNPLLTWLTFRDAFEGRRVKKVMCTTVEGSDPTDIGFSEPDSTDRDRITYFLACCSKGEVRKIQQSMYTKFDGRFFAKTSIGIAYSLFGEKALSTNYAAELYKGLWYREGDPMPSVRGTSPLSAETDSTFAKLMGESNGVSFIIQRIQDQIGLNLSIGTTLNWTVQCASCDNLTADDLARIGDGMVIILYKPLQRGLTLTLPQYMAHKCGAHINAEIVEINAKANKHIDYFKNL